MNSYLNDFLKIITGRAAIISVAVIIVFSLITGYVTEIPFESSQPNPVNTFYLADSYYSNSTQVFFITQAFNGYGQGISGLVLDYDIFVPTTTGLAMKSYNVTSGSDGFGNLTFSSFPGENMTSFTNVTLFLENSHGNLLLTNMLGFLFNHSQAVYGMQTVKDPSNPLHGMIHIVYLGPPANFSEKVGLYYAGPSGSMNKNLTSSFNYTFVKELNSFIVANIPINVQSNSSVYYNIGLYNSKGQYVWNTIGPLSFLPPQDEVLTVFYDFSSALMPSFVPLLAVFVAYFYFGKERLDGVLESVLVRPVTRGSITVSRFIASILLFTIASAAGLVIIDLFVGYYTGYYIPVESIDCAFWGLFVMCAGYIGLTYFLSNFMKSAGSLLGVSIGLYVLLSVLWPYFALALGSVIGLPYGSSGFIRLYMTFLYLSPAGYLTLGGVIVTHNSSIFGTLSNISAYGLTALWVFLGGLIWSIVPLTLATFYFRKRD
jgi:ABC-2 type transport system permease protein